MLQKADSSQVMKPEKRKFSEFLLTFMIMSIESEYDVICDNDREGHIVAIRNGQYLKVDIVTGEETPVPDYDTRKCSYCSKKRDVISDSDSDPDFFLLRWL